MRKKKGILITAVLACVVALGVGGYALAAQTGKKEVVQETKGGQTILPVLKVTEDLEMVNQEVWEHFVSETKKGNPAGIRVEMVKKLKGNVETISTGVWHNVTFDGKLYHYTSDDMDKTYRYLFRVHGTLPKAASSVPMMCWQMKNTVSMKLQNPCIAIIQKISLTLSLHTFNKSK